MALKHFVAQKFLPSGVHLTYRCHSLFNNLHKEWRICEMVNFIHHNNLTENETKKCKNKEAITQIYHKNDT